MDAPKDESIEAKNVTKYNKKKKIIDNFNLYLYFLF